MKPIIKISFFFFLSSVFFTSNAFLQYKKSSLYKAAFGSISTVAALYISKDRWLPIIYAFDKSSCDKHYSEKKFLKKLLPDVKGAITEYDCNDFLRFSWGTFYGDLFKKYHLNKINELSFWKRIQWWKNFIQLKKMIKQNDTLFTPLYNSKEVLEELKNEFESWYPVVTLLSFTYKDKISEDSYKKILCLQKFLGNISEGFCFWTQVYQNPKTVITKEYIKEQSQKMTEILSAYDSLKNELVTFENKETATKLDFKNLKSVDTFLNTIELDKKEEPDLLKEIDSLYRVIKQVKENKILFHSFNIFKDDTSAFSILNELDSKSRQLFTYEIIYETRCKIKISDKEENDIDESMQLIIKELKDFIEKINNKIVLTVNEKIDKLASILSTHDFITLKQTFLKLKRKNNLNLYENINMWLDFVSEKIKPYATLFYFNYLNFQTEKGSIHFSYHVQDDMVLPNDIINTLENLQKEPTEFNFRQWQLLYHPDKEKLSDTDLNNNKSDKEKKTYVQLMTNLSDIISTYKNHANGEYYKIRAGLAIDVKFFKNETGVTYVMVPVVI